MKSLTLKNFTNSLNNSHSGYFLVKAKDFVELINDIESKGENNNTDAPIKIWAGQRDYRGNPGSVKEIFRQVSKVPAMPFANVTVCYDRDVKEYYLLDGQHRYRRFLELFNGEVTCPKEVYWNGALVGRKTIIDADFPVSFKTVLENIELTMCIKNCSHDECKYIFTALNKNVVSLTDGDMLNADKYEDESWQNCKARARQYYNDVIDDKKYIATRLLYSLNEQLSGVKTDAEIKIFESWIDTVACDLFKKIFTIEKPAIANHNFTAFVNFCKQVWLNNKSHLLTADIVPALQDFYKNVDEVKTGVQATHQSVLDYTNVRALTSPNSWADRGNYIYNYMKYRNPLF